ncbi:MAG: four helix bundle protein [Dehalococcoidia bacterium]|nr:four helix bundle protein [Dehalococcoidia bacterium]
MRSEEVGVDRPGIVERSVAYSLRIINLYRELEKDGVGRILGNQLLRSGTSIGANVHEAQGGQSKADFIAKMSIAHKEARESAYWLLLIRDANLVSANRIGDLYEETEQLIKILSSILLTSKTGRKKDAK